MRAAADLNRARARYQTTRQLIVRDVRDAYSALTNASASAARWREDVRPRLERQAGQTQRAYELGELSYLAVIESLRRLNEGRISELDAAIAMRRAMVQLEHRIGRSCAP
jgi:cobalt-zinc-cadmium efflux system outer membrane protein